MTVIFSGAQEAPAEERRLTVSEYDAEEISNYMTGMLKTLAIICFLHFKMGVVPPLLVQCITNSFSLFQVGPSDPLQSHTISSIHQPCTHVLFMIDRRARCSPSTCWVPRTLKCSSARSRLVLLRPRLPTLLPLRPPPFPTIATTRPRRRRPTAARRRSSLPRRRSRPPRRRARSKSKRRRIEMHLTIDLRTDTMAMRRREIPSTLVAR